MNAELRFKLVDAFVSKPFTGNVAGVVLDADALGDKQMQLIAAELGAPATAFVLKPTTKDAAVRLRWFAPGAELGFCGHATLASVHVLLEEGRFATALKEPGTILPIESKKGLLTVRVEGSPIPDQGPTIWLDVPNCGPKSTRVVIEPIARHLGLDMEMVDRALPPIRTNDDDVILAVRTYACLMELRPAMGELARYCAKEGIRGVLVTTTNALSRATVTQSRFFAPTIGIDEDPVSGSVHGPLGLHLVEQGVVPIIEGRASFWCAQAKAGGRAGLVEVVVTETREGRRVRIGGRCATTAEGRLLSVPGE